MILISLSFVVALFGRDAVRLLFAPSYAHAADIIPLIALAYLVSQATGLLDLQIYQDKRTKAKMVIYLGTAMVNIALNILLIPIWGMYGGAIATVTTFVFMFSAEYWYARRCYFIPLPWARVAPVCVVLSGVVVAAQQLGPGYYVMQMLGKAAIAAVVLGLVARRYGLLNLKGQGASSLAIDRG